ncbi:hypothetical protein [Nonomuraea sp. NPDC048916]|uniref:hypothetical protein n=1 Tax=Nonomuraea sp. NPDC048916 TaxID=3154232 RepID=UPI0033EFA1F1
MAVARTPSHQVVKRHLVRDAWRTADPVWWRTCAGWRPLTGEDTRAIEDEFAANGRRRLLEG